jgi:hypothetical protein
MIKLNLNLNLLGLIGIVVVAAEFSWWIMNLA